MIVYTIFQIICKCFDIKNVIRYEQQSWHCIYFIFVGSLFIFSDTLEDCRIDSSLPVHRYGADCSYGLLGSGGKLNTELSVGV